MGPPFTGDDMAFSGILARILLLLLQASAGALKRAGGLGVMGKV